MMTKQSQQPQTRAAPSVSNDEGRLATKAERTLALERIRRHIPLGVSLSEELMAERKLEAERE
jgi:hypothetical protein